MGICLANYQEFSLYSFLPQEATKGMPTAAMDGIARFMHYFLIDGKFYTIFSLLFGIGFSIIMERYSRNGGNGARTFFRRMAVLVLIGLAHLLFLWAGDILVLYALLGMLLPLFRRVTDKGLLAWAAALWLMPVAVDACIAAFGWDLSAPAVRAAEHFHRQAGITWESFPVWLVQKETYMDVLRFNIAGSFIRLQEFIEGNRAFKVMGLFLLGLYIGRNMLYARLMEKKASIRNICLYGFLAGVPLSLVYAWNAMSGCPLGLVGTAVVYAAGILPMSFAYMAALCLWFLRKEDGAFFRLMAAPGRMALTNYIMQSVLGIIIFYGIGFALGAKLGLVHVEAIALAVFILQIAYSHLWLRFFPYGPLEWIWRTLTRSINN